MNLKIRKHRKGDAAGIARVHVDAWCAAYRGIVPASFIDALTYERMERFAEERLKSEHVTSLVAAARGKGVLGFIAGGIERSGDEKYSGEIYGIYVDPEYQNRGIGSRLVRALVEELQDSDIYSLVVWVLQDNPWKKFYESLNGQPVHQRMSKIGGKDLPEVAYGWRHNRLLLEAIDARNAKPDAPTTKK
jgi:ribosomal protein S18 acetylase RimI-like enzyme